VQSRSLARVDARTAAQHHDLGFPQVFGMHLVLLAQVVGKAGGGGRHAPDQRDILVLAFLLGQLRAVLPIADRLHPHPTAHQVRGSHRTSYQFSGLRSAGPPGL
jgi:hypothetical protein